MPPVSHPGAPIDPHLRRWMLFVDGENFTLQAQKLAEREACKLEEGRFFLRNVFVWLPDTHARRLPEILHEPLQETGVRAYYYTSLQGDDQRIGTAREALWRLGFDPKVFRKPSGTRAKGVDISLTLDVVNHAHYDHYDVAVLIAGDGDYLPLVDQVKRLGKGVVISFFEGEGLGLNPDLLLACDTFVPLDELFLHQWGKQKSQPR